jgi:hypothetical protein
VDLQVIIDDIGQIKLDPGLVAVYIEDFPQQIGSRLVAIGYRNEFTVDPRPRDGSGFQFLDFQGPGQGTCVYGKVTVFSESEIKFY